MEKIRYELSTKRVKNGMLSVNVNCSQYGRCIEIDTNVCIFEDEWNPQSGCVVSNPNSKNLNLLIRKTIYELETYELDYDGDFTLCKLEMLWKGKEISHDFYMLMETKIHDRDIRKGTQGIHERVLMHLRRYRSRCSISELTEDFVKGFIQYMRDAGLCQSTVAMHIRTLRCYYNIARKMFGRKVPAGTFDFYHEKQSDRLVYKMKSLTDDDIRLLENYIVREDTPKVYRERIDRFLFMSYTGTRISDFCSLTEKNITVENGVMWLTYTSVKTDTDVRLPLSAIFDGRAEQIINRYRNRINTFFYIQNRSSFNGAVETAAHKAGLNKHITAHVARHTCASRLINKDIPVTTIQKIVGHRSLKMTMVYATTNEKTLVRQLSK